MGGRDALGKAHEGKADAAGIDGRPAGDRACAAPAQVKPRTRRQRMAAVPRKRTAAVVLLLFVVVFCGSLVFLNTSIEKPPLRPTGGSQFAKATVEEVLESNIGQSEEGEMQGNQRVLLTITSGEFKGSVVEATSPYSNNAGALCTEGEHVVVLVNKSVSDTLMATVYNYDRGFELWVLIAVFLGLLCVAGGRAGVLSAVGLLFTFACLFFFFLPLIYIGVSPFATAVATVVLVTVVGIYLIGGWSVKTASAVLGTIAGVLVAGLAASAFGAAAHITGLNVDDVETLAYIGQNSKIDVSGLLFAGILISSSGAVMDVSMSVASTVAELHARSPRLGFKSLFESGMTVGRDMMGTMTHTLILAFAGGAINTIVIIYAYSMPYLEFMNGYAIGIEIMRGLSGSIGIILTVPFVSLLSAYLTTRCRRAEMR